MPAGPRQILEAQFAIAAADLDALFAESRDAARREAAEELNQAVRRLRQAGDRDELCETLSDAASRFAGSVLLFRVEDGEARSSRISVLLSDAPAISSAVTMQEPLVAIACAAEISASAVAELGHDAAARVHLFPVPAGNSAPALIYAWDAVQGPAIELLTQVAAAVWMAFPEPQASPAPDLVLIAPAPALPAPEPVAEPVSKPPAKWEDLPATEQQTHLRAQRFARVQVAEMRLQHSADVQSGRTHRNLYQALRVPIDTAREAFRVQFFTCSSMVDYLDLELTKTLAHDDPELLGATYPGPLV
jgi:hypothetical protein